MRKTLVFCGCSVKSMIPLRLASNHKRSSLLVIQSLQRKDRRSRRHFVTSKYVVTSNGMAAGAFTLGHATAGFDCNEQPSAMIL